MADYKQIMCDKCGKRPAVYHSKIIINGKASEIHLCEECRKKESHNFMEQLNIFLNPMGLIDNSPLMQQISPCPKCGYTFSEYQRTGFLGCPDCYDAFEKYLEPYIRKFQKDTRHTGKNPKTELSEDEKKYNLLLAEREKAVKEENFVLAAEINEKMKKLRGGI